MAQSAAGLLIFNNAAFVNPTAASVTSINAKIAQLFAIVEADLVPPPANIYNWSSGQYTTFHTNLTNLTTSLNNFKTYNDSLSGADSNYTSDNPPSLIRALKIVDALRIGFELQYFHTVFDPIFTYTAVLPPMLTYLTALYTYLTTAVVADSQYTPTLIFAALVAYKAQLDALLSTSLSKYQEGFAILISEGFASSIMASVGELDDGNDTALLQMIGTPAFKTAIGI